MSTYFNGVRLEDRYLVTDITRPAPGMSVETAEVPGRPGAAFKGSSLNVGHVGLTLWPHWMGASELRAAVREIAALFHVEEPARLEFGDDNGLYYLASQDGEIEVREYSDAFSVRVELVTPSPLMYGAERTVTVPSGGSVSFLVGGTYPATTLIKAPGAVRDSGGLWGVRLDDGDFARVEVPTASATPVVIDGRELMLGGHAVTVGGASRLMTMDSDWLELAPGHHTLANDVGTGACEVTWVERWL